MPRAFAPPNTGSGIHGNGVGGWRASPRRRTARRAARRWWCSRCR